MVFVRLDPCRDVNVLQRKMVRLVDDFFPISTYQQESSLASFPSAELEETPDAFSLRFDLPGIDVKNLDIQVTTEAVTVTGDRQPTSRKDRKGTLRSEFRYGQLQRTVSLPARINNRAVSADYTQGVLTLTLPKEVAENQKVVRVSLGA